MKPVWLFVFGAFLSSGAQAALTCDQLAAVTRQTLEARDSGASLKGLLSEVDRPQMRDKFAADELAAMRQAIRLVYISEVRPEEIIEACLEDEKKQKRRR